MKGKELPGEVFIPKGDAGIRFLWGILFFLLGGVLFLNTIDVLSFAIWKYLLGFWPVILILNGMHIIVGRNRFGAMVMLLTSLIFFFCVLVYAVSQVSPGFAHALPPQLKTLIIFLEDLQR